MTSKKVPPPFQYATGTTTPTTRRAAFAEALKAAELEFRTAQAAITEDDNDQARARYAKALAEYDTLQGAFPFVMAGAGDEEV